MRVAHKKKSNWKWAWILLPISLVSLWGKFAADSLATDDPFSRVFSPPRKLIQKSILDDVPANPTSRSFAQTSPSTKRASLPNSPDSSVYERYEPISGVSHSPSRSIIQGRSNTPVNEAALYGSMEPDFRIPPIWGNLGVIPKRKEIQKPATQLDQVLAWRGPMDAGNYTRRSVVAPKKAESQTENVEPKPLDKWSFEIEDFKIGPGAPEKLSRETILQYLKKRPSYFEDAKDEDGKKNEEPHLVDLGSHGYVTFRMQGELRNMDKNDFVIFAVIDKEHKGGRPLLVEVSTDNRHYVSFPCLTDKNKCAGNIPARPARQSPEGVAGGDKFDLADVRMDKVKYVRISDLLGVPSDPEKATNMPPAALDSVAFLHEYPEEVVSK